MIKHLRFTERIFVGMLDIGTVEKDAVNTGWDSSVERNADPEKNSCSSDDEI